MRSGRKVHFTGTGDTASKAEAMFWTPVRVARVSLIAVALVLIVAVYAKFKSTNHVLSTLKYSDQVDYMRQKGATGIKEIVNFLLYPDNEATALLYLKLVDGELYSAAMEAALIDALHDETGDNYLVSLALCTMGNMAGLPRFMDILRNGKSGETTRCCASFFPPPDEMSSPVQKHFGRKDDVQWAFAVIEKTIHHSFEGDTVAKKRETILNWWEANQNGTMIDWQGEFLKSASAYNRTEAFEFFIRKIWKQPEFISLLVEAMKNEELSEIRHAMACRLFRIGVEEALPIFDEYVRSAKSESDISAILATIQHIVELPSEFMSIDSWADGRDDARSFAWFRDWWARNYDLLVFDDEKWSPIGDALDNPGNNLFD